MTSENNMLRDMVRVFETTGGISVLVTDDLVTVEQESPFRRDSQLVNIPRPMLKEVLNVIFAVLDPWELEAICEIAETHAKHNLKEITHRANR